MDPAGFCRQARVLVVAGKGGVGRTTVSAAVARMAADAGVRTLVVDVAGGDALASAFGLPGPLGYEPLDVAPGVTARALTPDDALVEYLEGRGLRRLSRRLAASGVVDVVATAAPGIKDILVLGKVKQLERAGTADLIVVDAPAAGHALTFLTSAPALLDSVRVGPVRAQAEDVLELLRDGARCQVLLVTVPEETPVNEAVETAYAVEERVGVNLAPVVVNAVYPELDGLDVDPAEAAEASGVRLEAAEASTLAGAAEFRRVRTGLQRDQLERLARSLPLPQLHLPFLFGTAIGPGEVETLAGALADAIRKLPG